MARPGVIWLLAFLALVAAYPFLREAMRKPMNEAARRNAPGQVARLSQGVTHYQWHGAREGPVVVCIHGLTTPSFVWGGVEKGLVRMGYRVLTYDHFGRGWSDRPKGVQDRAFFLRQLEDLLADQEVKGDLTVIGYSMGGAIATVFAARHPDRIRHLVLLAPAGTGKVGASLAERLVRLPGIGAWLMMLRYPGILRRGLAAEKDVASTVPGISKLQAAELDWRGFVPAVRESLRGILSETLEADHRALKDAGVPTLAIWGADDDVIPLVASETLTAWNDTMRNIVINGAGHGLTYTHTDEVLIAIEGFVRA
jgi:pimeloyl-ACP methyl ester carboxylesterase